MCIFYKPHRAPSYRPSQTPMERCHGCSRCKKLELQLGIVGYWLPYIEVLHLNTSRPYTHGTCERKP